MKSKTRIFNANKAAMLLAVTFLLVGNTFLAAQIPPSPFGADAVPDLYAPNLAGPGGFTTTTGGAPASAINPAQGGSASRIVFDAGYLAIPKILEGKENKNGYIQAIEIGALFPTKFGVFGGSFRYIGGLKDQFPDFFPIEWMLGGNFFAAKEVYPGMSVGLGFNYGLGEGKDVWTASADLGFHYNTGNLGLLQNFTWAVALRGLGKSYYPSPFTLIGGVSFDVLRIEGEGGKRYPFLLNFAGDLGLPTFSNLTIKLGINMTIAEIVSLSVSWPGGSGLNVRELVDGVNFPAIPSVGLGINILLPSGGERIVGGRLPSDGDLKIDAAFKPLYEGVTAVGGGVTWYAGVPDLKAPEINIDYDKPQYFSPNHDGKADYLEIPVTIIEENYISSWQVEITDEDNEVIRTIKNKEQRPVAYSFKDFFIRLFAVKKQIEVPPSFIWDGIRDNGDATPDGRYFFTITSADDSGNVAVSPVYETILKNTPPVIKINDMSDPQRIFNPMGGEKDTITITMSGSAEEAWNGGIWNVAGQKIRTFESINGEPVQQVWDGKNDEGQLAQDGVYIYRISATDRAQNSAQAEMHNIILDAQEVGIYLTSSLSHIAPQPEQPTNLVNFGIRLTYQENIDNWKLELKDQGGTARRTFDGRGSVPSVVRWNGLNDQEEISEGVFTPELTVRFTRGDTVSAAATTVIVDVSGPALTLTYTPEYFSPDNDGEEDEVFIYLTAQDITPLAAWSMEIRDPEAGTSFYRVEGRGNPTPRLIWNGRSNKNELVQSATDYPYTFTSEDILGNASHIDGKIGVDVLVVRDGDNLRIQIPSIVFRPNFADFQGLPTETVDNNTRILRRIAQILNKFRDYKVMVEGHANPTTPEGTARSREEVELKRISEDRARAVVNELVRYGVARNRLSSVGVGGTRLIVPFDDLENRWKNRRVEFILIK